MGCRRRVVGENRFAFAAMRAEERTRELAERFRDFCARGCLAWRFCRGVCRRFTPAVCASLPVLCVRLTCRGAGLVCAAMRFLSPRPGFGLSLSLRFCRGALPSVHACLFSSVRKKETACGILRSYSAGSRSPFARFRGVAECGGWSTGRCTFCRCVFPRFTPGDAALAGTLRSE